jgi:CheY-like chemotaxis protein
MARICLLDDDEVSLSIIADQLRAEGHTVLERSEPIGTSAWVLEADADVLVTDMWMPALRGERVIEILANRAAVRTQFVLISSSQPSDLDKLLATPGVLGFIQKGPGRNVGRAIHRLLLQATRP